MPRFYGETMNIIPEAGQIFDDAMVIKNTSIDSANVNFYYHTLDESEKAIVDFAMSELEEDGL